MKQIKKSKKPKKPEKAISPFLFRKLPNKNLQSLILNFVSTTNLFQKLNLSKTFLRLFHSTQTFRILKVSTSLAQQINSTQRLVRFIDKFADKDFVGFDLSQIEYWPTQHRQGVKDIKELSLQIEQMTNLVTYSAPVGQLSFYDKLRSPRLRSLQFNERNELPETLKGFTELETVGVVVDKTNYGHDWNNYVFKHLQITFLPIQVSTKLEGLKAISHESLTQLESLQVLYRPIDKDFE